MAKNETTAKELKEKLFLTKKNAVMRMDDAELKKCDKFCEGYKKFLDAGKTEREAVVFIKKEAEAKGFVPFDGKKTYKAGDKVYYINREKAVILCVIGKQPLDGGVNLLAAHIDSPRLDLKQVPVYEKDDVAYFKTHYYGGIKKYQWTALPLALHGVVCLKGGTVRDIVVGEDESDPVFCIADILPHLAQEQMKDKASEFIKGEDLDVIIGSVKPSQPQSGASREAKERSKKAVLALLKEKYGMEEEDFRSAEIEIVPAGRARDLGLDRSLILAYGQDDRSCAFTSVAAMMDSKAGKRTNCCLCVDKEEIGSVGATGMASNLFENMVAEIVARTENSYSELTLRRCLASSNMLSSDVNAAFDPMNTNLFDKENASLLGGGVAFQKYTGSRGKSGANDANPEFIAKIRNVMDSAGVAYQLAELGKVDQGGGGTIAYHAARYGMNVIDAGVAVLSMHAPWEITSKEDIVQIYGCNRAFLGMDQD